MVEGSNKMSYDKVSRKAQMSHVVNLIILLAGAIIIFLVISKIFEVTNYTEAINVCRLSVMTQAATELQPTISGKKSPFDIKCDKRYVKFYNTKVELGLSPENMKPMEIDFEGEDVKKFRSLTDHTVDQVIAEELRICKYQFGDGKMEVFVNDESALRGKDVCYVCTEIDFESDKITQDTFTTLVDYTKKTVDENSGLTYYDYLSEESYTGNIMWSQPDLVIDKSIKYYVLFKKYNPPTLLDAKEDKKDVMLKDPARVEHYWVAIAPADKMNDFCDIQAN